MSALAPTVAHPPATLFDNSPTYQMACRQLSTVAKAINLDPGIAQLNELLSAAASSDHPDTRS